MTEVKVGLSTSISVTIYETTSSTAALREPAMDHGAIVREADAALGLGLGAHLAVDPSCGGAFEHLRHLRLGLGDRPLTAFVVVVVDVVGAVDLVVHRRPDRNSPPRPDHVLVERGRAGL